MKSNSSQIQYLRQKIAVGVEYNGSAYCGWQRQKHSPSVQQTLEEALSLVAAEQITLICAGRTDTGVHGKGQVVHFETTVSRPLKAWLLGGNSNLPDTVSINWVKKVSNDFNARFSALNRSYRYIIFNSRTPSALLNGRVTRISQNLDADLMQDACQYFIGEQDFSSIRAAHCQSNTPWRNISQLTVNRIGEFVVIDVTANAFLYHMVRNMVGILLAIGKGRYPPEWSKAILDKKDRTKAPATAPGTGLYLSHVEYPTQYGLPQNELSQWLW